MMISNTVGRATLRSGKSKDVCLPVGGTRYSERTRSRSGILVLTKHLNAKLLIQVWKLLYG